MKSFKVVVSSRVRIAWKAYSGHSPVSLSNCESYEDPTMRTVSRNMLTCPQRALRTVATLGALLLPLCAFAQLHVVPLTTPHAKGNDDTSLKFPLVTGGSEQADQRINTWLQVSQLQKLPGRYQKSPFEEIEPKGDSPLGTTSLDYSVNANTRGYLSLSINGEYDSASINMFDSRYNFDAQSGNPLTLPDLFSPQGLAKFTRQVRVARLKMVDRYLAELAAQPPSDPDQNSNEHRVLSQCRSDLAAEKENLRGTDFSLTKDALSLSRDCALSHYDQATADDDGPLVTTYRFQALAGLLSDYGRCLLIDQRTDCTNPHPDPSWGILHGTLDGRYPITLVYGTPAGDGYFYDKFGKYIGLDGGLEADGTVRLRESPEHGPDTRFVLKHQADGSVTGTWTQDSTHKTLAVALHP
ncbi:hypothetical protein SAMN05216466_13152 [Paraburkholderia phenazinium]|uniref:Uncharacterized protein n=2 Tax=Paraburkholderia phenazinium TaxID=60549 RepID=A0A1G8MUS5_9BURK|nr:hypothetical protein SAMN05216466_13152 [Paraburkholderia phenazinium]